MGMQGTASCDIEVDSAFVPDRRSAPFLHALAGQSAGHALHANPMYHIPFLPFEMNEVLPVIVGTHRGAAEALSARLRRRMGTISGHHAAGKVPGTVATAPRPAPGTVAVLLHGAHAGRKRRDN